MRINGVKHNVLSETATPARMKTPVSLKEPRTAAKDEFRRDASLAFSRALTDRGLTDRDLVIDIAHATKTNQPRWWPQELESLLPPINHRAVDDTSKASLDLLNRIKELSADKSYLTANLRDQNID